MLPSLLARKTVAALCLVLTGPVVFAQSGYVPEQSEYAIAGSLAGDQIFPDLALNPAGGYVVWQDNITDGSGLGISARKLNNSFSGALSAFSVNTIVADDQENARVSLLNDGGAAFVWQGGKPSYQRIYARFLSGAGIWLGNDVQVNTFTNDFQVNPSLATLTNGDVVVVWSSFNQEFTGSLQGIYGQRFNAAGAKLGGEFAVNQYTLYNQRTPDVAALSDGRFVVVWVSEQERFENSVDIYARIYAANGTPAGNEFLVNTASNICANPKVKAGIGGGFAVVWSEKDSTVKSNSWDIVARTFSSNGYGGAVRVVNATRIGDQYAPKLAGIGGSWLAVWISMGQDGSREGIYGRTLGADGTPSGSEFRVNTTTISQQLYPAIASDGGSRYVAVWSSFVGGINSFDLYAQRYAGTAAALPSPSAPWVTPLDSSRLQVAWPNMDGFSVANYEVYVDGAASPSAVVVSNFWRLTGLAPATTHTARLAYVLTDGRRSPLSAPGAGKTWGADNNYDGLPDDWQQLYFGLNWPSPSADSDGDGVSNLNEFLAGTNPTNAASVLRIKLVNTAQGLFLTWNTEPGQVYQVQTAPGNNAWTNLGLARFAAGTNDWMYVTGSQVGFYRVLRVR